VDAIQIQQVLFNLIRNAVEAMTAEGDRGDGAPTRCRDLVVSTAPAGPGMVEVAVSDSGPGLAPEVAGRLFEPFVSTKPNGMGVGLSICRSIVEAHGGGSGPSPIPGRHGVPLHPADSSVARSRARHPQAWGLLERADASARDSPCAALEARPLLLEPDTHAIGFFNTPSPVLTIPPRFRAVRVPSRLRHCRCRRVGHRPQALRMLLLCACAAAGT
jgi:hypothetical protein